MKLILLFSIAILICACSADKNGIKKNNFIISNAEKYDRKIKTLEVEKNEKFDVFNNNLFRPSSIRVDSNYLFISDFGDMKIKKFNMDGDMILTYGKGRGRGPSEFLNITDFDICGDLLWASDIQNMRVASFQVGNGTLNNTINMEARPIRITCVRDKIVVMQFGGDHLFNIFDTEGNIISETGYEFEEIIQYNPAALDGNIYTYKDGFLYLPFYASFVFHFDISGNLVNRIILPDGQRFINNHENENRSEGPFSAPNPDYTYTGMLINEKESLINIFSVFMGVKNSSGEYIRDPFAAYDQFDTNSGEYLKSFELPFSFKDLHLINSHFIGRSSKDGIVSYELLNGPLK